MAENVRDRVQPANLVRAYRFEGDGEIPNSALPLLVYPGAVEVAGADPAAAFERMFSDNGWGDSWRNGIFPFPHYHSTAHEALGIARGEARVRFGGAGGAVLTVRSGDVVVIPAGVGHQNLGASADLLVVGAYPGGSAVDLRRGGAAERPAVERNIAGVPLPAADPVHGADGPLLRHWRGA
jgi:uncharacterized protein YjlB